MAIKLLHIKSFAGTAGKDARARLRREAKAMAKVNHANVVSVYEVGQVGQQPFIAMEYAAGGSLLDWLKEIPQLPLCGSGSSSQGATHNQSRSVVPDLQTGKPCDATECAVALRRLLMDCGGSWAFVVGQCNEKIASTSIYLQTPQ